MDQSSVYQTIQIVYFSGTGGARRVAEAFADNLKSRGLETALTALDVSRKEQAEPYARPDLLILVFALHAFDAPAPVYAWAESAHLGGVRAAVISVSGGGEHWPNTGCRNRICKTLESGGATVVYEKMMVMPCNWVFSLGDEAAMHLLQAVPDKVQKILDAVLAGHIRRTKGKMDGARAWVAMQEKAGASRFPQTICVSDTCTGCGWCARNCPTGNIAVSGGMPSFSDKCVMCFRCVYGCPIKALGSKNFMVLRGGFDLESLEKRMGSVKLPPVDKCFGGAMWKSARDYLLDKDGY